MQASLWRLSRREGGGSLPDKKLWLPILGSSSAEFGIISDQVPDSVNEKQEDGDGDGSENSGCTEHLLLSIG